jgi:hypothetical protein
MEPMVAGIDPAVLGQAILALAGGPAFKTVSATPRSTGYAHGSLGLLSYPGLSQQIINAMLLPTAGLASRLPAYKSNEEFPLYGIVTGVTAGAAENTNAGVCDDPPTAGLLKLCSHSFVFGRRSLMTPVIEIDRVGRRTNRGEFLDMQLVGDPFANTESGESPSNPPGVGSGSLLNNEIAKAMFELRVDWIRRYGPELYSGNPSNNTAGGQHKYFRGLDLLINTGWRDAETGVACPAADPIVVNFASANVSTSNSNIVRWMTNIARRLKLNARNMGLAPVKWVLVMRETLFYELTEAWPCSYATYRCSNVFTGAGQPQVTSTEYLMKIREEMRGNMETKTGQFLYIDGERWEVVFDETTTETALANGAFNSSIYFVPLTVIGGRVVTYMEYYDYGQANGSMDAARAWAPDGSYFTTDGDAYLWHKRPPTAYCIQAQVKNEPRLIFRAPHLSAKILNVAYSPLAHERDWATTGYYHLDGGGTSRGTAPSFFSPNASVG